MKVNYYATCGDNGLGVYTDYYDSYAQREYLQRYHCKKFRTLYEARMYAMYEYNSRQYAADYDAQLTDMEMVPINRTLFRKSIVQKNRRIKNAG
jgi:hypothetical protein